MMAGGERAHAKVANECAVRFGSKAQRMCVGGVNVVVNICWWALLNASQSGTFFNRYNKIIYYIEYLLFINYYKTFIISFTEFKH